MLFIGYYYSDNGVFYLYKSDTKAPNWVSNICYYDSLNMRYYSPNIKHLAEYGRDADGMRKPEHFWTRFITSTHDSFVFM